MHSYIAVALHFCPALLLLLVLFIGVHLLQQKSQQRWAHSYPMQTHSKEQVLFPKSKSKPNKWMTKKSVERRQTYSSWLVESLAFTLALVFSWLCRQALPSPRQSRCTHWFCYSSQWGNRVLDMPDSCGIHIHHDGLLRARWQLVNFLHLMLIGWK